MIFFVSCQMIFFLASQMIFFVPSQRCFWPPHCLPGTSSWLFLNLLPSLQGEFEICLTFFCKSDLNSVFCLIIQPQDCMTSMQPCFTSWLLLLNCVLDFEHTSFRFWIHKFWILCKKVLDSEQTIFGFCVSKFWILNKKVLDFENTKFGILCKQVLDFKVLDFDYTSLCTQWSILCV